MMKIMIRLMRLASLGLLLMSGFYTSTALAASDSCMSCHEDEVEVQSGAESLFDSGDISRQSHAFGRCHVSNLPW